MDGVRGCHRCIPLTGGLDAQAIDGYSVPPPPQPPALSKADLRGIRLGGITAGPVGRCHRKRTLRCLAGIALWQAEC
jgi:hypothetical protein